MASRHGHDATVPDQPAGDVVGGTEPPGGAALGVAQRPPRAETERVSPSGRCMRYTTSKAPHSSMAVRSAPRTAGGPRGGWIRA
jgi:hypothetical protein